MVPAGAPTESTVAALGDASLAGRRRSSTAATPTFTTMCAARDAGGEAACTTSTPARAAASGGCTEGYCLMVGGEADVCRRLEPIFLTLAPPRRLPARRRARRRPLREDDPQRHRVRPDAGLRRRFRADARERVHDRPRRGRRALDARQRRALVAARADRARARRGPDLSTPRRRTSRIRAKDDGRCTRRSSAACRCPC